MKPGWRVRLADPMFAAICALGVGQITAWGTSYYCLGVLAGPISAEPLRWRYMGTAWRNPHIQYTCLDQYQCALRRNVR